MKNVVLRYQLVSDAKRFVEILSHPDFIYFPVKPQTIEEEKRFLRQNRDKRKQKAEYNFSVIYNGELIGAIGIKIDQARRYIGEIGYFIDRWHWGKGLGTAAVLLAEEWGFSCLGLHRIEIVTLKKNIASRRVAEKCNYRKEGVQRGKLKLDGSYLDAYLFAKTKEDLPTNASSVRRARGRAR